MPEDRRDYAVLIAVIETNMKNIQKSHDETKELNAKAHDEIKEKIDYLHNLQGDIKELRKDINWLTWIVRAIVGAIIGLVLKVFGFLRIGE